MPFAEIDMLKRDLPDDVLPGQVWRAPDGQHYKVFDVEGNTLATLQRCTAAGRVLNVRFKTTISFDRMRAEYALVRDA